MEFQIDDYLTADGSDPYWDWNQSLDPMTRAKVHSRVFRLSQGNFQNCKPIADAHVKGVRELRIDLGPGYRVYFGRDGEKLVLLLTGGVKKSQRRDVVKALEYWKDYKARKGKK